MNVPRVAITPDLWVCIPLNPLIFMYLYVVCNYAQAFIGYMQEAEYCHKVMWNQSGRKHKIKCA